MDEDLERKENYTSDFGNEVYMGLFALCIAFLALPRMIFFCVLLVVFVFFFWRASLVWAPARRWWRTTISTWRRSIYLVTRFAQLAARKKTPEVNGEMAQLQGIMAARKTSLFQPTSLLTPVWLFIIGVVVYALTLAWGAWPRVFTVPHLKAQLRAEQATSDTAVGANAQWAEREARYEAALKNANEEIERANAAAISGEIEAYKRGRKEGERVNVSHAVQRRLEQNARDGSVDTLDPVEFLRDIGIETTSGSGAGGSGPDPSGAADPTTPG